MGNGTTWIGMDVHKGSVSLAVLTEEGELEEREVANEPEKIRKLFRKLQVRGGDLRACYEAGPCGYTLHRQLTVMGVACEVIAPSLIPQRAGDRIKTDRRDARKLAGLYRAGELTPIRVPQEQEESARDLMRCREDVLHGCRRYRQQLAHFLNRHGRVCLDKNWSAKHWAWIRTQRFEDSAAETVFREYVSAVEDAQERLHRLEAQIEDLSRSERYAAPVGRLRCLRGISTISAMTLLAEVLDFRRFATPRALMAYLGLVPSEYSSGARRRQGGITKAGNVHARRILVEAAWHYRHRPYCGPALKKRQQGQPPQVIAHAMKAQRRLHDRYQKMAARGKPPQVVVVAIARELAAFVWAILVDRAA